MIFNNVNPYWWLDWQAADEWAMSGAWLMDKDMQLCLFPDDQP